MVLSLVCRSEEVPGLAHIISNPNLNEEEPQNNEKKPRPAPFTPDANLKSPQHFNSTTTQLCATAIAPLTTLIVSINPVISRTIELTNLIRISQHHHI